MAAGYEEQLPAPERSHRGMQGAAGEKTGPATLHRHLVVAAGVSQWCVCMLVLKCLAGDGGHSQPLTSPHQRVHERLAKAAWMSDGEYQHLRVQGSRFRWIVESRCVH